MESVYPVSHADLNSAEGFLLLSPALPVGAVITAAYIEVSVAFEDNGVGGRAGSSTIRLGFEDIGNGDLLADSTLRDNFQIGTTELLGENTITIVDEPKPLAVIWTEKALVSALTAGSMDIFVEWNS